MKQSDALQMLDEGTLSRPRPIGRTVRLLIGILCLSILYQLISFRPNIVAQPITRLPNLAVIVLISMCIFNYVVNIGFGRSWGRWPLYVSLVVAALLLAAAWLIYGTPNHPLFGVALWVWLAYFYAHLGIAFVLSAIIATPGCEMRSIPELFGKVRRRPAAEHHCPAAFITKLDEWEQDRHAEKRSGTAAPGGNDILAGVGGITLFYGLPFLALQIAGNLGGLALATAVPAVAFTVMGIACIVNVWRSRRVHCYFAGPWFLAIAALIGSYGIGLIDFGPSSWQIIVNPGLLGGLILYYVPEYFLGRYFGAIPDD